MNITQVQVKEMWGKNNIEWNNVDPRVNILVGPNGSGKSTFLQLIRLLLLSDKELNKLKTDILIQFDSGANIHYRSEEEGFSNRDDNTLGFRRCIYQYIRRSN